MTSSTRLMLSAEEERAQQAPLLDDGDSFGATLMQAKSASMRTSSSSSQQQHQQAHAPSSSSSVSLAGKQLQAKGLPLPVKHASGPQPISTSTGAHTSRPSAAASPSASSPLPHALSLPFQHVPSIFHANAVYLAPNASPSQLDGLTAAEEFHLRAHTCLFMSGMAQKMKLGQLPLATASVYVQVFFTHYSFKALDRLEIALTCLFLAGKVEERRIRLDQVIEAFYGEKEKFDKLMKEAASEAHLYAPRPTPQVDSPEWDQLRNRVYEYEAVLLDAIEYNFDVLHPYSYLRKFIEKYIYSALYAKESDAFIHRHLSQAGGIAQIAWNFINDSLRTSLCLQYSPSQICVAAIRMAMMHLINTKPQGLAQEPVKSPPGLHPNGSTPAKPWHEELFGMSKKTVTNISKQILDVLEVLNTTRPGYLESLRAVHLKTKVRSTVPLPCPRSTQDLMETLRRQEQQQQAKAANQRAMAAQRNQQQAQQPASGAQVPAGSSSSAAGPSSDRKRARSPGGSGRKDGSSRPGAAGAVSPLSRMPSPFLQDPNAPPMPWVPDLRPNKPTARDAHRRERNDKKDAREHHERAKEASSTQRQQSRERERHDRQYERPAYSPTQPETDDPPREREHERTARERPRDHSSTSLYRLRDREESSHRSRGGARRSRSRSQRRSRSRDSRRHDRDRRSSGGSSASAQQQPAPVLEEGEVLDSPAPSLIVPPHVAATVVAAGGPPSRNTSGGALTKSSSTMSLAMHHHASGASHPQRGLHSSASMVNLTSSSGSTHAAAVAAASDILSGDILRMSSCQSPSDVHDPLSTAVTVHLNGKTEEDIMRSITREARSLTQERAEEERSPHSGDEERATKRARTISPVNASLASQPGEFEPTGGFSTHSQSAIEDGSLVILAPDAAPALSSTFPSPGLTSVSAVTDTTVTALPPTLQLDEPMVATLPLADDSIMTGDTTQPQKQQQPAVIDESKEERKEHHDAADMNERVSSVTSLPALHTDHPVLDADHVASNSITGDCKRQAMSDGTRVATSEGKALMDTTV